MRWSARWFSATVELLVMFVYIYIVTVCCIDHSHTMPCYSNLHKSCLTCHCCLVVWLHKFHVCEQLRERSHTQNERRVPELNPVLCSQPAGDRSQKPSGRLPLLSARPAVTSQPPSVTAHWLVPNYTAWWQSHICKQLAQGCTVQCGSRDSNLRPVDRKWET